MPVACIRDGSEIREVELPKNATLLDAVHQSGLKWRAIAGSRWRAWIGRGPKGGEPVVYVLAGHDRLTPPSACEVRRFGDQAERCRLPSQAGLLGDVEISLSPNDSMRSDGQDLSLFGAPGESGAIQSYEKS